MVLPLIGRLSLRSFGIGAAAAAVGAIVARPLLVGIARVSYEAADYVGDAWHQAKIEAERVKSDALAGRDSGTEAELRRLREEVAALRAQPTKRTTA